MQDWIGLLAAILIGISLGLTGSGGSILTVPVLVYLFGVEPVIATAYSLPIVGMTALIGTVTFFKKGLINLKTGMIFGGTSILSVFLTRKFLVPAIPDVLMHSGSFVLTKNTGLMVLFSLLMISAAVSMIRNNREELESEVAGDKKENVSMLMLLGLGVGFLAGLLGAGGGFMIIPALVLVAKIPIKKAIGTSLFIIALQSLIGFTGDMMNYSIEWSLIFKVAAMAVIGIIIGSRLSHKIDGKKLKPGFGWFVLVMGVYIIIREVWLK